MKTNYTSDIVLGQKYRDKDTGLEGTATSIHFYKNACERVVLQYLHKGDLREAHFDSVDLVNVATGLQATAVKTGGPARSMPKPR